MQLIPNSLNETIGNNEAYSSFMTHLIFKGKLSHMPEKHLPPSLQEKVLSLIKQRLLAGEVQVEYHVSDLLDFVSSRNDLNTKPVFYSISDILSFVDFSYVKTLVTHISKNKAVIVGRSFLRNRLTKEQFNELSACGKLALHDEEDPTRMYQVFSIKTAIE